VTDAAIETPIIKRRHVAAAVAGNALEFYDFTTYSFFSIAIGHAFFPAGALAGSEFGSLMLSLGTFFAGFLLRPVGGIVLGHYADRVGRRPAMLISFTMMGLAILALALIPSYSAIGIVAPILAITARLTQGFALGGEVGPSTAYLVEGAPANRRGLYASWQSASQSAAAMVGGTVGLMLALYLSKTQLDIYGWRVAFILGALTLPFGLYIRRSLPESLHTPDHLPEQEQQSFAAGFATHGRVIVLALFILIGGTVATYVLNYMTTFAQNTLHMGAAPSYGATMINGVFGITASLAGGILSDIYGRRVMMIGSRVVFVLLAYPVFMLIVHERSTTALLFGTAALSILLNLSSGAFYVAFIEVLPKRVRGGIFGTVYAIAISIFGGSTQAVIAWLIHVTGNPMAPAWYLLVAITASLVAMILMTETAPARLAKAGEDPSPGLPPTA
jgi:MFS family permease